jgi:hypothetical protein
MWRRHEPDAYVGGNPVNFIDASGLSSVCEDGLSSMPDGSHGDYYLVEALGNRTFVHMNKDPLDMNARITLERASRFLIVSFSNLMLLSSANFALKNALLLALSFNIS